MVSVYVTYTYCTPYAIPMNTKHHAWIKLWVYIQINGFTTIPSNIPYICFQNTGGNISFKERGYILPHHRCCEHQVVGKPRKSLEEDPRTQHFAPHHSPNLFSRTLTWIILLIIQCRNSTLRNIWTTSTLP